MLTDKSISSVGQRGERQEPNEARWKKEQTKDLLKGSKRCKRQEQNGRGGWGHIQRHSCVQIGLMSLCYKRVFFFVFTAPRAEYVCIVFIKIYMF